MTKGDHRFDIGVVPSNFDHDYGKEDDHTVETPFPVESLEFNQKREVEKPTRRTGALG